MNEMSEKKANKISVFLGYTFAIIIGLSIGGLILLLNKQPEIEEIKIFPTSTQAPILVHVVGEVKNPGVYEMSAELRIQDLIDAAGGFTNNANTMKINLASSLYDGQQVTIPSSMEMATNNGNLTLSLEQEKGTAEYPININYCGIDELVELPGIGQTRAEAIILYREQNGNFEVIEDIMNVSGIGPSIFESIKDKITVK